MFHLFSIRDHWQCQLVPAVSAGPHLVLLPHAQPAQALGCQWGMYHNWPTTLTLHKRSSNRGMKKA
jgi:hypothetical protein